MTTDKTTYVPVEDEPEPSSFYDVVRANADNQRNPWDHHHDQEDEES